MSIYKNKKKIILGGFKMPLSPFVSFKARCTQHPQITIAGREKLRALGYIMWCYNVVFQEVTFLVPVLCCKLSITRE